MASSSAKELVLAAPSLRISLAACAGVRVRVRVRVGVGVRVMEGVRG